MEFPLHGFKLDRMHALALDPNVTGAVGLRYGKLFIRAKTKFYVDQMKIELEQLWLLVF